MKKYISPSIEVIITEGIMQGNGLAQNSGDGYIGGGGGDPGGFESPDIEDNILDGDMISVSHWKHVGENRKRLYSVFDD